MLAPLLSALLFFFQAPNEPKLATIEGTITHAASKTPIRKAKVNLTGIGFDGGGNVEAGDDGKFILKDVKPGRYRITAEKAGYESTGYGSKRPQEPGQVLRVDAGAHLTSIDVAMPKHGVIAGKILDFENEPMPNALVLALTNMYYQRGRRGRIPRGTVPALSNDLGEFRIGQLPPGKYIVCAVPMAFLQPNPNAKESKPTVEDANVTSCFPNVGDMNEATAVEIKDAIEVPGIDVRMGKSKTVTVKGQISGVPAGAGGGVTILNMNRRGAGPIGNATSPRAFVQSAEGKFEFKNVPPGSYVLHTMPTGLGTAAFVVKANVEIGNEPVTDLVVSALVPFEVKAKIVADPGPELKLSSVRVALTPVDEIQSALAMGMANADGNLTLTNVVPGKYRVQFMNLPGTHYVKELRTADHVADADEVEIAGASTHVTISLGAGKGEINGMALNEKGQPYVGAHVAIVPEPPRPYRMRNTRTDQNGAFKLINIPPGEYNLIALEGFEQGGLEDDEYVKPLRAKMKRVKVEEGGNAVTMELRVLPAPER
jgi:hypothetical protein